MLFIINQRVYHVEDVKVWQTQKLIKDSAGVPGFG